MIRGVTAVSLIAIAALVLYLPATSSPEQFVLRLRAEHQLAESVWGADRALRVLDRALALHSSTQQASPIIPAVQDASPAPAVDALLAQHVASATTRLFASPYFRSIEAMSALAAYRAAALVECLPLTAMFVAAALLDGVLRRRVKSREFVQHSAELFGLHVGLVVVTLCGVLLALVVPATVHPYALAAAPVLVGVLGNRAIANFHAR